MADDVVVKITAQMDELRADLGKVRELLGDLKKQGEESLDTQQADSFRENLEGVADAAGAIGEKFSAMAAVLSEASHRFADIEKRMQSAFQPGQAEAATDAINDLDVRVRATAEDLEQAAIKLNAFGQFNPDNLRRVADVAAVTGESLERIGEIFGKLGQGSKEAADALKDDLGIDPQKLKEFGAVLDENGELLLDTPRKIEAAKNALARYVDTSEQFRGAAERGMDASSRLADEWEHLKGEVGDGSRELKASLAEALLPWVQGLRGASKETKGFVGTAVEGIGILGSVGSSALSTAAQVGILTQAFPGAVAGLGSAALAAKGFAAAQFAALGPLGLAVAAVAAVAYGFRSYTKSIEENTARLEETIRIHEEVMNRTRGLGELWGKTADEIERAGQGAVEATGAMLRAQEMLDQAIESGDQGQIDKWTGIVNAIRATRRELQERDAERREAAANAAAAEQEAADSAVEAWENFKKRASAGWYETAQAQLEAFDQASAGLKRGTKEWTAAQLERVALARKAAEEQKKAAKESAEATLKADLHRIDVAVASGNMGKAAQIAALQAVLRSHQVTADERMRLEKQIASLTKQAADEAAKAAEDAAKRATEKRLAQIDLERAKLAATRELTVADEIAVQEKIVRAHKAGTTERMKEEAKLYELRAKAREQDEESARKLQELAGQLKEAEVAQIEDAIRAAEDEKAAAEAAGKSGEEAQAKIVALLEQKKKLLLDIADAEAKAAAASEKDPAVRAKMAEVAAQKKADVERDATYEVKRAEKERLDILREQTGEAQKQAGAMRETASAAKEASSAWANGPATSDNPNFGSSLGTPGVGFGQNDGWSINGGAKPAGMSDSEKYETREQAQARAKKTHEANAQFKVEVEQREVVAAINNLPSAIASAIGSAVASAVRSSGGTPTQRAASAGRSFQESNMKSGGGT